jgi:hypothetical protein
MIQRQIEYIGFKIYMKYQPPVSIHIKAKGRLLYSKDTECRAIAAL